VRPRRLVLITLAALAFLAVSFELALVLAAEGKERAAILAALERQARAQGREGEVKILRLDSSTRFSLSTTTGTSRVAWATLDPRGPTVVQCARVRRTWSFTSGAVVTLERLSAPIGLEAGCRADGPTRPPP
jgi:hypothetical protein